MQPRSLEVQGFQALALFVGLRFLSRCFFAVEVNKLCFEVEAGWATVLLQLSLAFLPQASVKGA